MNTADKKTCGLSSTITFLGGLMAGTLSAVSCKFAYSIESQGIDGESKLFEKPIFMLLVMFMAMIPAGMIWLVQQSLRPVYERDNVPTSTYVALIIPSICDLLCTLLLLEAQLYITASLWQMMRGSVIVITALLKRYGLGHTLESHMWSGIIIIASSMVMVACSSIGSSDENPSGRDPRIGIMLVVLGCVAQGVQYVFEERVLNVDSAPPLVVIGMEGLWGTIITTVIVYPVAYTLPGHDAGGSFENPWDSWAMVMNSSSLSGLVCVFIFTVTAYNIAAVYVTQFLSAIWHAILDNFRPISVWGLDLAMFYVIAPESGLGECWTEQSYLQLGGLILLLYGTAVYNGSVKNPFAIILSTLGLSVPPDYIRVGDEYDDDNDVLKIRTDPSMASPALTTSPLLSNASLREVERNRTRSRSGSRVEMLKHESFA
jgi:drug/metabolite transporter (DMT)-like permease